MEEAALFIHPTAKVSPDARIHPSTRGTKIRIGAHSEIYDFVVIRAVGGTGDIEIGEHCYINPHSTLYSGSGIRMGNYVLVGPHVAIVPANHAFDRRDTPIRHQGFSPSKGGVVIGDDVWIGANATLLDGARIGKGAVIAAGAVVDGEVPPYQVWGGVPARFLKQRP
ncbi:MAG: acyltransferase [Alphaproteobacteria bacterium]|nr:acyltransferase [Alphaproteobacteria bacterium]